jgi:hypothetical protein
MLTAFPCTRRWNGKLEQVSRFVVPVSATLAIVLSGALGLTVAGVVSMEAFGLLVPACLLVLWTMGDWRSPAERAAAMRGQRVRSRTISRPRLGN